MKNLSEASRKMGFGGETIVLTPISKQNLPAEIYPSRGYKLTSPQKLWVPKGELSFAQERLPGDLVTKVRRKNIFA